MAGQAATEAGAEGGAEGRGSTRLRLLLAAEKLFAEQGIEAVSMRSINVEANQRNVSALHYHFGSRDAIIEAIFDHRMGPASLRRREMLDDVEARGAERDVRELVRATIWPLAEQVLSANQPSHYIRFLAQAHRSSRLDSWLVVRHDNRSGLVRAYVMVMRAIEELPRPVVHFRAIMGLRQAIYFLADLDRVISERHPEMRDVMVRYHTLELVDRLTAELRAPISPDTMEAFEALSVRSKGAKAPMFGVDTIQALNPRTTKADG